MKQLEMNFTLLVVEDDDVLLKTLSEVFSRKGFHVLSAASGAEALALAKSNRIDLALLDLKLPDMNGLAVLEGLRELDETITVIVMTAYPDIKTAISAMKAGANDYINKPFELDELKLIVEKSVETITLRSEVERLRYQAEGKSFGEIIGDGQKIKEVKKLIGITSETPNTSVLILGATGTGKELVASAIHNHSERRNEPFIKVNCSAIPASLLESELFGYEKGAFTDARQSKKGLFEIADGGTLFLDEIGDMDLNLQPKILQVLENRNFRKLGGTRDIQVDVRIITATNQNIEEMVRERKFRGDLYYRLKVMVIDLPPLRERMEDIIPLAEHFIHIHNKHLRKNVRGLSKECNKELYKYSWPGNVRELKNILERAVILASSGKILPEHLPHELLSQAAKAEYSDKESLDINATIEEVERRHILKVMQQTKGNKSIAAKHLGICRLTLREKLKKYSISED
ncbi:MAG: sigma-54-dependent Fis family transcriptional regulator [Nitrospira sp.]|nr:sigma-54-dependent Fis family transcriptional regulator [Nitrospira sp.]